MNESKKTPRTEKNIPAVDSSIIADETLDSLRADRDSAILAAQKAVYDTTRLTRLLTIISEPAPLDEMLDRLLQSLSELLSSDIVVLFDPVGTGSFAPICSLGLPEDVNRNQFDAGPSGAIQTVMNTNQPLRITAAASSTDLDLPLRDLDIQHAVWLPVSGSTDPRGALLIARCRPKEYSASLIDLMSTFTRRIGMLLEQSQHTRQMEKIESVSREIRHHFDQFEIGRLIASNFHPILGADACVLVFPLPESDQWQVQMEGIELPLSDWWIALTNRFLNDDFVQERKPSYVPIDEYLQGTDFVEHMKKVLAVPILYGDRGIPRGVLYAIRYLDIPFASDTLKMALIFAGQADIALENASLYHGMRQELVRRKRAEEALENLAYQDTLTGLANRAYFIGKLKLAIDQAAELHKSVALIFIDLDNFKVINDSLGHKTGDEVLRVVSRRISSCLRENDVAARLGGDEFTVLIDEVDSIEQVKSIAGRILSSLKSPIKLDEREVFVNSSLGIALNPSDETDPETFLRNADLAMYSAKEKGKGCFVLYDSSMNEKAIERLEMETQLRLALQREEFRVYYQPIVNLMDGRIAHVEALVRWQHPDRGLILPDEFLSIAEETGLILEMGHWVFSAACHEMNRLRLEFPHLEGFSVSINLSTRQLMDTGLVEDVKSIIQESGMDPRLLMLEVTENSLIKDTENIFTRLHQINHLGVTLAMDDFGVGYANLNYIKQLPIRIMKIDRSFVTDITDNVRDRAIVRNIIDLCHTFGYDVIGEGVETEDQAMQLKSMGCKYGQGYLFSKPIPLAELRAYIRSAIE